MLPRLASPSGLGQALPLALAAAVYPPALIVLLLLMAGAQPRKLVGAYFIGAALIVVGVGVVGLAALQGANLTTNDSHDTSAGVYFVIGVLLLALSAFAWRHKPPPPKAAAPRTRDRGPHHRLVAPRDHQRPLGVRARHRHVPAFAALPARDQDDRRQRRWHREASSWPC